MDNKRKIKIGVWSLCIGMVLLLSGCMSGLRSETIIIPDTAEAVPADHGSAGFEVNTIYRLPYMNEDNVRVFTWVEPDALIRLYQGDNRSQILDRYDTPFEKPRRVLELDSYIIDSSGLSPDGRYFTGLAYASEEKDNGYTLSLLSVNDGMKEEIDTLHSSLRLGGARALSWSSNSRYISYFTIAGQGGETGISVYDTEIKAKKSYLIPDLNEAESLHSVKLSNDGGSAVIVKEERGELASFVLGRWKGGQFVSEYEHTLADSIQVDWLDNERIVFVGTDGTLFTYDRRNAGISVLLDQVEGFQLSTDRQYIAYATKEAVIDVAKLQGNNLLNKKSVYRGLVAMQMAWSPDNGSLLIQGRKPYEIPAVIRPAPQPALKDNNNQLFIVEFKK